MTSIAARPREKSPKAQEMTHAYQQHALFVRRSLQKLGVLCSDADDAVQQVFLVVDRRYEDYADIYRKRAWLFNVSKLVSRNYHRGLKRQRNRHLGFVPSRPPDVEEIVAAREARRIVDRFLQDLGEAERLAFYLANVEGLTAREIAQELAVNMNTVYSRLRTARLRFERSLAIHRLRERA